MTNNTPVDALFKALADPTRLRIARLLATMELAVGELAQVLGQSQPRVSRHVGILCDAGLAERRREGSWVFLRGAGYLEDAGPIIAALDRLLAVAEAHEPGFAAACEEDRRKLAAIEAARDETAEAYFARHASEWDELRALHSSDGEVETRLLQSLSEKPLGHLLDIGTGTGRMAELLAPHSEHIVALDKSLEMLKIARARLQHLTTVKAEIVQGDFTQLPFASGQFDTVLLHQVLHFAHNPQSALAEAARVTKSGGRIAIVDFDAHTQEELRSRHQHVRLGFTDAQMTGLLQHAGFTPAQPAALEGGELVVKIWIGERRAAGPLRASTSSNPTPRKALP